MSNKLTRRLHAVCLTPPRSLSITLIYTANDQDLPPPPFLPPARLVYGTSPGFSATLKKNENSATIKTKHLPRTCCLAPRLTSFRHRGPVVQGLALHHSFLPKANKQCNPLRTTFPTHGHHVSTLDFHGLILPTTSYIFPSNSFTNYHLFYSSCVIQAAVVLIAHHWVIAQHSNVVIAVRKYLI